jgi:hypothetical protein
MRGHLGRRRFPEHLPTPGSNLPVGASVSGGQGSECVQQMEVGLE